MSMPNRDPFSLEIKRALSNRVGSVCSRHDCQARTSGLQSDSSKAINIGVAAHITAAARGGPRFDAKLTPFAIGPEMLNSA
jgi:hypothetical protein